MSRALEPGKVSPARIPGSGTPTEGKKTKQKLDNVWRNTVTPEGVPVRMELASRGDRLGAVLIDLLLLYGAPILLFLTLLFSGAFFYLPDGENFGATLFALIRVLLFLWYNFYFIFFEIRWQGRTPGKRLLGLRVVDRRGGQLTSGAIFARNLMRELELFLPLSLLFVPTGDAAQALIALLSLVWVGVFLCIPFFNKDRMRVGDMIAGTWVVRIPKTVLMEDIVQSNTPVADSKRNRSSSSHEAYSFTDTQVDAYGIYELQTLEEILRKPAVTAKTIQEVAERIRKKIKWQAEPAGDQGINRFLSKSSRFRVEEDRAFLEAYYAALRRRLENRMLFGQRKENKHQKD
ncbi:RDD family protein [Kiloniella laminariae]|uniref:RDD family protein n=1 Tax=Kiloniella laminariae TaxID=454162 RepID=A0ABT4LNR2_9PROT|nr:RDD family protein [Kiloniella laminariae]MCZ4282759.1 RDD family protein [Kiloniella laminariae]